MFGSVIGMCFAWLQEDAAWHARYHQLRHFKQAHHHLDVPAPLDKGAQAPDNLDDDDGSSVGGGSSSRVWQWEGLADWLQQQRQSMAASDKVVVHLQPALSKKIVRLNNLHIRMLKSIGVHSL